jgi:hypothetical protein
MMRVIVATLAAISAFFGVPATGYAATVNGPPGQVLVRTSDGFTPIDKMRVVEPGVQIAVLPGSLAHISYNNQCLVVLGSGRVWTVPRKTPCTSGQWVVDLSKPAATGAPPTTGGSTATTGTTGILIAGGLAAGAGIFLATQAGGDSKKPASP